MSRYELGLYDVLVGRELHLVEVAVGIERGLIFAVFIDVETERAIVDSEFLTIQSLELLSNKNGVDLIDEIKRELRDDISNG